MFRPTKEKGILDQIKNKDIGDLPMGGRQQVEGRDERWISINTWDREKLIERIEGYTGSLKSVPWSKVTTEDMRKLLRALWDSV